MPQKIPNQWAKQAGHGELMGWTFEMSAWFALVEGNYEQLIDAAQAGQGVAGGSNAGVQLLLQEAKGWALPRRRQAGRPGPNARRGHARPTPDPRPP